MSSDKWWRLIAGTLASVRLRFTALRSAFSKFPRAPVAILSAAASKEALPPAGSRRARLPRGALAEAAIAASGNASEESEPEPEQLPPRRRPTRQQKTARKPFSYMLLDCLI